MKVVKKINISRAFIVVVYFFKCCGFNSVQNERLITNEWKIIKRVQHEMIAWTSAENIKPMGFCNSFMFRNSVIKAVKYFTDQIGLQWVC